MGGEASVLKPKPVPGPGGRGVSFSISALSSHIICMPIMPFPLTFIIYTYIIIKDENISFDGYIGTWILRIYRIYRKYIGGYFYMNIDISKIKLL